MKPVLEVLVLIITVLFFLSYCDNLTRFVVANTPTLFLSGELESGKMWFVQSWVSSLLLWQHWKGGKWQDWHNIWQERPTETKLLGYSNSMCCLSSVTHDTVLSIFCFPSKSTPHPSSEIRALYRLLPQLSAEATQASCSDDAHFLLQIHLHPALLLDIYGTHQPAPLSSTSG